MSTMLFWVTVSCTSAPSEVGGVSSTSALISEARIGAVIGSAFSLLALFVRLHPARFHHLVSFDDSPSRNGLSKGNSGISPDIDAPDMVQIRDVTRANFNARTIKGTLQSFLPNPS